MPRLKISGKHHRCSCGASMAYSLDETSEIVIIGCTNVNCSRCFIQTQDDHLVGEWQKQVGEET